MSIFIEVYPSLYIYQKITSWIFFTIKGYKNSFKFHSHFYIKSFVCFSLYFFNENYILKIRKKQSNAFTFFTALYLYFCTCCYVKLTQFLWRMNGCWFPMTFNFSFQCHQKNHEQSASLKKKLLTVLDSSAICFVSFCPSISVMSVKKTFFLVTSQL